MNARALLFIVVSLLMLKAGGQGHIKEYSLDDPHARSVSIPFELVSNLIIIPLRVNQSQTLHMILDSGVKTAIITELHGPDTLPFTYSKVQVLQGLGEGRSILAYPSYGNTIHLDGVTGIHQDIYILGQNDINLSGRLGRPVNGLIGYDLLKDFVVEIDYPEKRLVLYAPEDYRYHNERRAESFPLDIRDGKPYVNTSIRDLSGDTIDLRLLIDTGGGFALWLSPESDSLIAVPDHSMRTYLGYGLGGEISGSISRAQALLMGPFELSYPTVAFPDSGAVSNVLSKDSRNGSIGADILRRFDITFDYPAKQVTLRPNSGFSDEFSFNRSGIELYAPIPGVKVYFVSRVQEGSAAEQAGIRVNDQILQINLRLASECDMNDINAFFHGKHGEKLRIRVLRGGEKLLIRFPLEDKLLPG